MSRTPDPSQPNPPDFDRVAAIYHPAEYLSLGPILQRARTHLLPYLTRTQHALILGDGDGRFLEQLLLHNPRCDALAVDVSAAMLHRLRRRCLRSVPNAASRLHALQQNILTLDPPPATDLVVTHFVLDCLSQPEVNALTARLAAHLTPGALWLVSDFALPSSRLLRPFAALYIRALYAAFHLLTGLKTSTLPDPQTALHHAGFTRIHRHTFLGGLIYTELWRLG